MMKRILSFVLAAVLLVGLVPATVLTASAADMKTSDSGISMIKGFEGFNAEAYQHGSQWYIGYGTEITDPSLYPNGITPASAEALLKQHLKDNAEKKLNDFMKQHNVPLSQTKFDALASLCYNVGTGWLNDSSSVIRAYVLNGTGGQEFVQKLVERNSLNPQSPYFKGLVDRRLKEANLYLNGQYNSRGNYTYVILRQDEEYLLSEQDKVLTYSTKSLPNMPAAPSNADTFLGWYTRSYTSSGALAKEEPVYSLSGMGGKTLWPKWSGESKYTVNAKDLLSTKVYQDTIDKVNGDITFPAAITDTTKVMCNLMANSSFKVLKETVVGNIKWAFGEGKDTLGAYCKGWVAVRDTDNIADNTTNKVIATAKITLATGVYVAPVYNDEKMGDVAKDTVLKIVEKRTDANKKVWGRVIYKGTYAGKQYDYGWIDLDCAKVTNESYTDTNPYLGKSAVVTNCAQLNVRNAAGMSGTSIVNRIAQGTKVTIYDTTDVEGKMWAKIKWGEANEGWVYTYYLNVTGVSNGISNDSSTAKPDVLLYTGIVTSNTNLNVRQQPVVNGTWVTSLPTGTKVNIYEVTTTMGHRWGRTEKGWICLDYVNLTQVQQPATPSKPSDGSTGAGTGVTMSDVNAYQEADNNSKVMFTLKKGESIAISEQVPQKTASGSKIWGKVTVNGVSGWVNMAYVEVQTITVVPPAEESGSNNGIDPVNGTAGVIANASIPVNVRIAAGVQNDKVASLAVGTAVTVYELTEVNGAQWARIKWNGNNGWVAKQYVNLTGGIGGTGNNSTANGTTPGQISLTGTVNSNINLNVRSGAGLGNPQIASLPKGTKVTVYEQVTADGMLWGKINVNGTSGWVCMSYISVEQTNNSGTGVMGTIARCFDSVNVRSAPGVGNAIVGKLKVGTRVEIFEQRLYSAQYWGRVAQGWICMEYVVTDGIVPEGPLTTETTQETTISSDAVVNNNKELTYNIKGTTIVDRQYIYKDATDKSGISGTIDNNQRVTIVALKGDGDKTWGKITDYNTPGWIDLDKVSLDDDCGYTSNENQAVYAKPDTTSTVVQVLHRNTKVIYKKYAMRGETPYVGVILADSVNSGPSNTGTPSSSTTVGVTGWIPMSMLSKHQRVPTRDNFVHLDTTGKFVGEGYAMALADIYETYTSTTPIYRLAANGKARFALNFFNFNENSRVDGGRIRVRVQNVDATAGLEEGWIDVSSLSFTAKYKFPDGPINARANSSMDAAIMGRVDHRSEITISSLMCDASGNVWGKLVSSEASLNNYWVRMDGTDKVTALPGTDIFTTNSGALTTGRGQTSGVVNAYTAQDTNSTVAFTLAAGANVYFSGADYMDNNGWIKVVSNGNIPNEEPKPAYIRNSDLASFSVNAVVTQADSNVWNVPSGEDRVAVAVLNTGSPITISGITQATIDGTPYTFYYIGAGYINALNATTILP